jgi:transcriptional regulator with XRE-family HTH domain
MSDRLAEYGPLIDAEPTRQRIKYLREETGLSVESIARLSGVSPKSLASLIWGIEGRPPTSKVRQDNADRIFGVRPRLDLLKPTCAVDSTGTRRRLQALQVLGWSPGVLSSQLSMSHTYVNRICRGELTQVRIYTANSVKALYERMWDKQPPESTRYEQMVATRMRRKASRNGWAAPMAWDDDEIDRPSAEPEGVIVKQNAIRKLPEWSELLLLVDDLRETDEAIAQRFDVHIKTVKTTIARARRKAATQQEAKA